MQEDGAQQLFKVVQKYTPCCSLYMRPTVCPTGVPEPDNPITTNPSVNALAEQHTATCQLNNLQPASRSARGAINAQLAANCGGRLQKRPHHHGAQTLPLPLTTPAPYNNLPN